MIAPRDLSSSRVLWVQHPGPCFLATAVYGEGADELAVFRSFRDRVLIPSAPGRWLVRGYYAAGPSLARAVVRRAWLRRLTRMALSGIHRALVKDL